MADLALVVSPTGLVPSTQADAETVKKYRYGEVLHGEFRKMRNPKFHRRFFALLDLAFDYWEPEGGLITRAEHMVLNQFVQYLAKFGANQTAMQNAVESFLDDLARKRLERYPALDKSREAFREWITVEAGFYTPVNTPSGVKKIAKSISFASMDDTEFRELYKAVFNVCWRVVLSKFYGSEQEAENTINILLGFA